MTSSDGNPVTPDVTHFDPDRHTFAEAGSSQDAKRWADSTQRSREFRKRKKLGLEVRTIRVSRSSPKSWSFWWRTKRRAHF